MAEIKYDAILVGGLDNRAGDLDINQQTTKFKEGYGTTKNVKSYRYNATTAEILKFLGENPFLPIFLFSAGCTKAFDLSQSKFVNKNLLFVIEPYGASAKVVDTINKAVMNGVPSTNVYVGSGAARGAGIVKNSSPSGSASHWDALKEVGRKQSGIIVNTTVPAQPSTGVTAPQTKPVVNANTKPPVTQTSKGKTSAVIGDFISSVLQKKYSNDIDSLDTLTGNITTTADFLEKIKKYSVNKDITKLVISIGSLEVWGTLRDIGTGLFNTVGGTQVAVQRNELVLQLRRVFPNAELFILNGSWGWEPTSTSVSQPSVTSAQSSKYRFTYEFIDKPLAESVQNLSENFRDEKIYSINVYERGNKILDYNEGYFDLYTADNFKALLKLLKERAIEKLIGKYGEEIKGMVNLREEEAKIKQSTSLLASSTCSDDCWGKKIDAYMLFYTDKKFTVIGTKKKLSSSPTPDDALFATFDEDLKKYKILAAPTTTLPGMSQSQAPIGQPVSKGDLNNAGEDKKQDSQKNQLVGNNIVNLFPTQIRPKEIVVPTPENKEMQEEFANGMGYLPIIWYNVYQIDMQDVQVLSINYEGILPILTLVFRDSMGLMKDKGTPIDNNSITIFISSRSKKLRPVHLDFKIKTFTNMDGLMNITGTIDIDNLYVRSYKTYKDSTSNKALQDVCKEIGLGFNTNVGETNDRMNWINTGSTPYEFMQEILDHAYISDESFVSGNIDLFYNFNFVDIQKELSRDINKELGVSSTNLADVLKLPTTTDEPSNLFISNDESVKGTNNFFSNYKVYNVATKTALDVGYSDNSVYYDTNIKKVWSFDVHSMNLNEDSSIVLKGGNKDGQFYDNNKRFVYSGKLDSDNSHVNYNYTKTNNDRNIFETEKLATEIELPFPNFNLYRFQKLKLIFSHNVSTPAAPQINSRYTGDWLIIDIKYFFAQGKFKQKISLVRRELGLSSEEIVQGEVNKTRPQGRGNYSNPAGGYATQSAAPVTPVQPSGGATTGGQQQQTTTTEQVTEITGRITTGIIKKNMTFEQATVEVIKNLEGGYYHPSMYPGRLKDDRLAKSGETMYGIDRKEGNPGTTTCPACKKFWALLDEQEASKKWAWLYIPPEPLKSQLINLAVEIMKPQYQQNMRENVKNKQLEKIINSDGRLMFNAVYASWNGPGWFAGFLRRITEEFEKGMTNPDDLVVLFVKLRLDNRGIVGNKSNNSLIKQGGEKIAKLVGVEYSQSTKNVATSAGASKAPELKPGERSEKIQQSVQTGITTDPATGGRIGAGYVPLEGLSKSTQNLIKTSPGLILVREGATKYRTAGTLWYRGKVIGYTVEDAVRTKKIEEETAIPAGTFNIFLDITGKNSLKDSYVQFPDSTIARERNPGVFSRVGTTPDAIVLTASGLSFQGIRIHRGIAEGSSHGCIIYSSYRFEDGKVKKDIPHNERLTRLIKSDGIKSITIIDEFKNLS